jgi:phosphoesterase RecJ-like protein
VVIDLSPFLDAVPVATIERLRSARRVLAVGHEHPDADTLGASLAVTAIVEANGGIATPVCTDPVPSLYDFIPGIERVRTDPDATVDYDLLVVSDCGSLSRVGAVADRHRALFDGLPALVLDHHVSNEGAGPDDWIDPGAAATCEMVSLLAVRMGFRLDALPGLATTLMAGIVMDTATFAHPNATPRTLAVAAALVEAGAPLSDISRRLYRTKPDRQLQLFGRVLARLERAADGLVVHSSLLDADLIATGTGPSDSEGIIDLLSQSETAAVVILFKEQGPETRISVRTKAGGVDATELTGAFGGGGHARAAGATVDRPLEAARPLVLAEAERLARRSGG